MSRKQYPDDIYLSPCFAIKRFLGLRDKHGDKEAILRGEFKPEREMWVTGVFLLGISQLTKKEYWLRVNIEDTAPDTFAISLIDAERGVTAEIQNIEIFEYESHAKMDLTEAIKKKLANKTYPDNYLLLCYVHGRAGEEFKPKRVFEAVKTFNPQVAQIWILANVLSDDSADHVVVRIFPNLLMKKFDYLELCKISKQIEMIRARRDLRKKITKVEFEPLGDYILKLP